MSFTVLKTETVTTRKPHQCLGCCIRFPAGTRMEYWFAAEDGTGHGSSSYMCMRCLDYTIQHSDVWNDPDEGVDFGFVTEHQRDQPLSVNGA